MDEDEDEEPDFDTIIINVSGKKFETCLKTLSRFPDTRLGSVKVNLLDLLNGAQTLKSVV